MTDKRIKMWYTYTMEYYSATKRSCAVTWMKLEIIILSSVS